MKTFFAWTLGVLMATSFYGSQAETQRQADLRNRLEQNFGDIENYLKQKNLDDATIQSVKNVMVDKGLRQLINCMGDALTGQKGKLTGKEFLSHQRFVVGPFEPLSRCRWFSPRLDELKQQTNITQDKYDEVFLCSPIDDLGGKWLIGAYSQFAWELLDQFKQSVKQAEKDYQTRLIQCATHMGLLGSQTDGIFDLEKNIASKIQKETTYELTADLVDKERQRVESSKLFTQPEEEWRKAKERAAATLSKAQADVEALRQEVANLQAQLAQKTQKS